MYMAGYLGADSNMAPVPTTASDPHRRAVKTAIESLVFLIRGDEGLSLPSASIHRIELIARDAVARLDRGNFPALTSSDLSTIHALVAKTPWAAVRRFFTR